jgi:hypothetical protein
MTYTAKLAGNLHRRVKGPKGRPRQPWEEGEKIFGRKEEMNGKELRATA